MYTKVNQWLPLMAFAASCTAIMGLIAPAEDCVGYYSLNKGSKSVTQTYDDKGQMTEKSTLEIIGIKKSGHKLVATAKAIAEDLKKGTKAESTFDIECDETNTTVNSIQILQANLTKSKELHQSSASGNNPTVPNNLQVGQDLPESTIKISIRGEISMDSQIRLFDRKVVAMEKITVPAGTFDCAVISYTNDTRVLFDKITKHKVWMAKGVGVVKSEQYSKKGKLEKRSELTSFSK